MSAIDRHGIHRHAAGAPASQGGRFATTTVPAAATQLVADRPSDPHGVAEALTAVANESRRAAENVLRHTFPTATSYRYTVTDDGGEANVDVAAVYDAHGSELLAAADENTRQVAAEDFAIQGTWWATYGRADDFGDGVMQTFDEFDDDWRAPAGELSIDGFEPGRIDYAAHRASRAADDLEDELHAAAVRCGVRLGRVTLADADESDEHRDGTIPIDVIEDANGDVIYDRQRDWAQHDYLPDELEAIIRDANNAVDGRYRPVAALVYRAHANGAEGFHSTTTPMDMLDFRFRRHRGYDGNTLFGSDSPHEPLSL